uniref:Uncharacterized protein n=1 Tax=Brassica campestris TaxID=3711 RepID=M4DJV0_BRACM
MADKASAPPAMEPTSLPQLRFPRNRGTEQQIGDSPAPQLSPRFQWKAKSPPREQDATSHQLRNSSSRPSLGRNLERTDFSPPQNVPSKEVGIRGGYNPSANLQWREKTPTVDQEATSQQRQIYPPRQNQEHIVTLGEASLLSAIPSKEQVMEELREVTLQYLNVEDPTERAARQKRVLQSEMDGTVEETAANIIHASTAAALATFTLPTPQELPSLPQATSPNNGGTSQVRRRGRTAKTTTARKVIRLSPKTYSGMGSRKRNLAQLQAAASPGPSNKPATKPARKQRRATTAVEEYDKRNYEPQSLHLSKYERRKYQRRRRDRDADKQRRAHVQMESELGSLLGEPRTPSISDLGFEREASFASFRRD